MYLPLLEVPADLLAWMRFQNMSAFVGDMLRLYERNGGLTQGQLNKLEEMRTLKHNR